ncbi:MAG TPA: hypothetical protein PKE63_00415 [Lacibacter sp.]|nr:hypothetical protein [Lacibacter sp.]HMO88777.1 hypothetical protein [Lacibacter sp.]HMP85705.1 hypothetical protein [Lacibacter sp.]
MRYPILLLFILSLAQVTAQEAFRLPAVNVLHDSAVVCGRLTLFPIKRVTAAEAAPDSTGSSRFLLLREGLKTGSVAIKERGPFMLDNIGQVLVENNSNKPLLIRSGDILLGGRQDRVFARDTLLEPGTQVHTVPVFCIEEGRWSKREKPFAYGGQVATGLQQLIDSTQNQTLIWNAIRQLLQERNQRGSTSYAALTHKGKTADTLRACLAELQQQLIGKDSNYCGILAVANGKVLGADLLLSESLFYQTLPLLLEKYLAEAWLGSTAGKEDYRNATAYAAEMLSPASQQRFLAKRGKRLYFKGQLIQITGF